MALRIDAVPHSPVLTWGWRRIVAAIVAGAASSLALAPLYLFPVLWLTVPVLVWLLDGATGRPGASWFRRMAPAFWTGWGFGLGYFVGGLWWLGAAFLVDAARFAWLIPAAVLALPAGLALFWGAAAAIASLAWSESWTRIVILSVLLSGAEWLRGHVLTGFPWNAFGYTLMPSPLLMQIAAVIGLWGVTLLAFLVFAAPALLLGASRRAVAGNRLAFGLILALFAADLGYGALRLAGDRGETVPDVKLRLVQPVFAQEDQWAAATDDEIMTRYLGLSATGMEQGKPAPFTYLIWPETAFPFFLTERPNVLAAIGAFLPSGATLITGAVRAEAVPGDDADTRIFNSIYIVGDDGTIRDAYDKVHLVPFGEYLPFERLLTAIGLRQLVALPGGFDAGHRHMTFDLDKGPSVGPLICYEVIFPGSVTDPSKRPHWLVNVTNDAWFGNTAGPYQHLQQAVERAVEEGIPIARAANSGISAIIDPYGRVIAERKLNSEGVVDGALPVALAPTIYSRAGDLIYFALSLLLSLLAFTVNFAYISRSN